MFKRSRGQAASKGLASVGMRRAFRILALWYGAFFLLFFVPGRGSGYDDVFHYSYIASPLFDADLDLTNDLCLSNNSYGHIRGCLFDMSAHGYPVNYFPIGTGLLWAPFLAPVRLFAVAAQSIPGLSASWMADRFSSPYLTAVSLGTVVYGILALLLCHRLCRFVAGSRVGIHAALLATAGTSLLQYVLQQPTMTHVVSALAATCVVFLTIRNRHDPRWGGWALTGAAVGLAALIRWQDLMLAIVPAAVVLGTRGRGWTWRRRLVAGAVSGGMALVVFSIQFFYWYAYYGDFFANPHGSLMQWSRPQIYLSLFSGWNGLFYWHPVLLISLVGMVGWVLCSRNRALPLGLLGAAIANIYVSACVYEWHGGGAFGGRKLSGLVPVYALGLAVALKMVKRAVPRFPLLVVTVPAIVWNVVLMVGFERDMFRPFFLSELSPLAHYLAKYLPRFIALLPMNTGTFLSRLVLGHDWFALAVALVGLLLLSCAFRIVVAGKLKPEPVRALVAIVAGVIVVDLVLFKMALPANPAGQEFARSSPIAVSRDRMAKAPNLKERSGPPALASLLLNCGNTKDMESRRAIGEAIRSRSPILWARMVTEGPLSPLQGEFERDAKGLLREPPYRGVWQLSEWAYRGRTEETQRKRYKWARAANPVDLSLLRFFERSFEFGKSEGRLRRIRKEIGQILEARARTVEKTREQLGPWHATYVGLYHRDTPTSGSR